MKKIILTICLLLCLTGCNKEVKTVDYDLINQFDFSNYQEFSFDLHCQEYLLLDLSNFELLYGKDIEKKIFPASLTKLATLDTVLNKVEDLNETSSISYEQILDLIQEDASLAGLKADYEYTINDLLYALILPSGADGAKALENYFENNGLNLIEEINKQVQALGCSDTSFVNSTGLHDDNHYSCLLDILKICLDVLSFEEGRKILETMSYRLADGKSLKSSLCYVYDNDAQVLGGKTGYTTESGQSVLVLYKSHNRSYIMLVANAMGNVREKEKWHFDDAMEILKQLY